MAKVTEADIRRRKAASRKLVLITAYYYEMARAIDQAEPDIILVGDSGGEFLLGHPTNNDVTLDEMIVMTRAVARGAQHAMVIADLPYMTYQTGVEDCVRNAARVMKEARCDAVKPEGGAELAPQVAAMVRAGIPVLAHTGLTAATRGDPNGGELVWRDVQALQDAGAFGVMLRQVPPEVGAEVTKRASIPTFSASVGDQCDGWIAISPQAFGWTQDQIANPRSPFGSIAKSIYDAAKSYTDRARAGEMPQARR